MRDTHGNTLTITDYGIYHSSGRSIQFVRNQQGFITQIIDPAGHKIYYNYDQDGNLISVTDREGLTWPSGAPDIRLPRIAQLKLIPARPQPIAMQRSFTVYHLVKPRVELRALSYSKTDLHHSFPATTSAGQIDLVEMLVN